MTPTRRDGVTRDVVDVAILGDGPAGSALAQACRRAGIDVTLVGDDAEWSATYSTWADELADPDREGSGPSGPASPGLVDVDDVLATSNPVVWAYGERAHRLERRYTTLDNVRLRAVLRSGVRHRVGRIERVSPAPIGDPGGHRVELAGSSTLAARLVVDATGWPASFARRASDDESPAWQTALGVVLPEPPRGDLGRPTFMDFRQVTDADGRPSTVGPHGVTTFCYSLPVADGWLVEETVLAARPAIEPIALLPRLAARLGRHPDRVLADSVRTEYVRIPLGGARPLADQPIVAFGSAAGYVHATTGFSVAASIRAAPRVAGAITGVLSGRPGVVDPARVAEAVWPTALRRTRVLHDFGLDVLLDLDEEDVRTFFDAFFDLAPADWSAYLRIDTPPSEISAVMGRLFRSSSWRLRRRLAGRNPASLVRLLRP